MVLDTAQDRLTRMTVHFDTKKVRFLLRSEKTAW